jgi:hypothetical protein
MARNKRQISESLIAYYGQSVGGSVLESYRHGKTVSINADHPATPHETPQILEARAALEAIEEEINAAYWLFSRSASRGPGKLADPTLYARRNSARDALMDLQRWARIGE